MKNLDDCKAEIFRRSEERIRKRNKVYKYIVTGSLSLFLFFSLGSMVVVPILRLGNKGLANQIEAEDDRILENQTESASKFMPYDKVEIIKINASQEDTKTITDLREVTHMFEVVFDTYSEKGIAFELLEIYEQCKAESEDIPKELAEDDGQKQQYRIIFSGKTGESITYILEGNVLYEEIEKKGWILTEEQRAELETYMH